MINMIKTILAIPATTLAIPENPKMAATIAMRRKIILHRNII